MSEEVKAPAAETPTAEEPKTETAPTVETPPVEGEAKGKEKPVDTPPVETAPVEVIDPEAVALKAAKESREEFARMKADFGVELAAQAFAEGKTYAEAREMHIALVFADRDRLAKENADLKKQLAGAAGAATPAAFAAGDNDGKKIGGVPRIFVLGTRRQ